MTSTPRWEVGSVFPFLVPPGEPAPPGPGTRLYGSGRQALRALVTHGRRTLGWRTLHMPAYYCPEVVDSVRDLIPVRRYDAGPFGPPAAPRAEADEVVLTVSYFGAPPDLPDTDADLIVDVTHDPVAPWLGEVTARADFVFASLRKTLPLPDGGAVWAGRAAELPPALPPTEEHLATVSRTLSAMCLKAAYLDGIPLDKADYLALFAEGEAGLRATRISGISDYSRHLLAVLPQDEMRRRRLINGERLSAGLRDVPGLVAHQRSFGVLLEFADAALRDRVRADLIAHHVYPAMLWTLPPEETPESQVALSRRLLYLHTDIRWDTADMDRVVHRVRAGCTPGPTSAPGPARPVPRRPPPRAGDSGLGTTTDPLPPSVSTR
ncbi:hypothetical protein O7602_18510 [Micromonospora sp. WMMD1128]|uniref:hypothetical protein n=1 Tax=Micromonospora sp. WMMD1128 TaxID=3015150 RepID=UPI00248C132D|nr:hypothetical protein [Micromonospora sp. WMMD1128]WBB71729.1 hypothetical protein O7602_18510 [Micromonospora sp. WMMD1128]